MDSYICPPLRPILHICSCAHMWPYSDIYKAIVNESDKDINKIDDG